MKPKAILKVGLDVVMTALFLLLMAYHVTGNRLHEWLGMFLFIIFILHNVLNLNWYKRLFKGRYAAMRIFNTLVNALLMIAMLGTMVSGIMISRAVFGFLDMSVDLFLWRKLHMAFNSWLFLFMAVHLGFHWGMVMKGFTRMIMKGFSRITVTKSSKSTFFLRITATAFFGYGVYAFMFRRFWVDLFMLADYPFFNFGESAAYFFIDYLAIIAMFVCLAYYLSKLARN